MNKLKIDFYKKQFQKIKETTMIKYLRDQLKLPNNVKEYPLITISSPMERTL